MKKKFLTTRNVLVTVGAVATILAACESKRIAEGGATGDGDVMGDGDVGPGDGDVGPGDGDVGPGDGDIPDVTTPIDRNAPTCADSPLSRKVTLKPGGEWNTKATEVLGAMTIEEKIAILSGGPNCPAYDCDFDGTGVPSQGVKDFKMRDGPRGVHTHDGTKATSFAVAMARAASFDLDLENRVGKVQGKEMVALQYDLALAPTLNVLRHPAWARAQETYGEDPVLLGLMSAAFTNGVQEHVPACPKHFAANNTDENRGYVIANMDEQTLREVYTKAFQITVEKSDPACIMAAYNGVNGYPMTENYHLLTEILRDDWAWDGFVVSDWWATTPGAGQETLNAGTDIEMPDDRAFTTLTPADSVRVEEAAMRVMNARAVWGQLEANYNSGNPNPGIVEDAEHKAVARETAEKGAVLLSNDGILPIKADVTSIIIMGPDANLPIANTNTPGVVHGMGDRGSSNTNPPYAVSYFDGISERAGDGVEVTTSTTAGDAAGKDIVIIPVTMQHEDEGEAFGGGGDRDDLTFNANHPQHWGATKPSAFINQVAAVNPNVIVLIAMGSAVVMEDWGASARSVVQTFYPGQEGGHAVAALLFGDKNFYGRLPFTVATAQNHYPYFGNQDDFIEIDYLHGYRKFEQENIAPRFWFGHGLSYTTFTYGEIELLCDTSASAGAVNAKITVTNSGTVAGDELVQAYVAYPNRGDVRRPNKELKAFARTGLLAPGEAKDIFFSIPVRDIAYWSIPDNGWKVQTGVAHDLVIASSASPTDTNLRTASFTPAE